MAGRMILHDTRLKGRAPPIAPNTYAVDETAEIEHIIGWVNTYARSQGGLDELLVMCHGFESNADLSQQASVSTRAGGFGLQIGKQGLSLFNVSLLRAWRQPTLAIRLITIYSCAAADTGAGNAGTYADGRRFMGEMAIHSGAAVVASSATQAYNPESVRPVNPLPIDFGDWEGPVFRFDPDTGAGTRFAPGPMR